MKRLQSLRPWREVGPNLPHFPPLQPDSQSDTQLNLKISFKTSVPSYY
jgi:hypothetical protein